MAEDAESKISGEEIIGEKLQFDRWYEIQIGGIKLTLDTHDVDFIVDNMKDPSTATAELVIYNLSEGERAAIKEKDFVKIYAGYKEGYMSTIFVGKVDKVFGRWDIDVETRIKAVDDFKVMFDKQKVSITYSKGTPVTQIVQDMFMLCGIPLIYEDPGVKLNQNMTFNDTPYHIALQVKDYTNGELTKGKTSDVSEDPKQYQDTIWTLFIENGYGFFVAKRSPQAASVPELSSETGLMEVREHDDEDKEYDIETRSLMIPQARVGGVVQVKARFQSGTYKIIGYKHICRWDGTYHTIMRLKKL